MDCPLHCLFVTGGEKNVCVSMSTGIEAGLWKPEPCNQTHSYICKVLKIGQRVPVTTTAKPVTCRHGWTKIENDCYKVRNSI